MQNAWNMLEGVYNEFRAAGIRKEDARFLLPNAAETRMVVSMPLHAWSHFCWLRAVDKAAQWEITGRWAVYTAIVAYGGARGVQGARGGAAMTITYNIKAIETEYKGRLYRSRLEAKWAAFFDLCGWNYEYEPVDFDGWFPDFGIYGDDGNVVYVEVKPVLNFPVDVARRMWDATGGGDQMLILGTKPLKWGNYYWVDIIGWLYEPITDRDNNGDPIGDFREWDYGNVSQDGDAALFYCKDCNRISFNHTIFSFGCRLCSYLGAEIIISASCLPDGNCKPSGTKPATLCATKCVDSS